MPFLRFFPCVTRFCADGLAPGDGIGKESKDNTTNILLELCQAVPRNIEAFKFFMDMPITAASGKKVTLSAFFFRGNTDKWQIL